eukprot:gene12592-6412_t
MDSFDQTVLLCFLLFHISAFLGLQFLRAPYGKFANESAFSFIPKLNGKFAFGFQESASFFTFVITLYQNNFFSTFEFIKIIPAVAFSIHYFHRCFIFPFRTFSMSDSNIMVVLLAFSFTLTNGYLNAKFLTTENVNPNNIVFWIGFGMFVYGFYVNYVSDDILIGLRSKSTPERKYSIPNEGYFKYIASANYFGELIEWFGFYLMCWNYAALVFFIGTFANLVPRAIQSRKWYTEKFGDEYPKNRKAIIPFIL